MCAYRIGIDLGGSKIAAGVVGGDNHILGAARRPTDAARDFGAVADDMAAAAREAAERAGIPMEDVGFVGVGAPGFVNPARGLVVYSANLEWHNVELWDAMRARLGPGPRIAVANDADCAVFGEVLAGAAQNRESAVLLTLGTGVGGGIVIGRKIYAGCDGMGAELGHVRLVYGGERCSCGQSGCVEAYCSARALVRQTARAIAQNPESLMAALARDAGKVSGRTAFLAARQGDAAAQAVVDQYIEYLAAAISSVVNIFRSEVILLGGGVSHEGEPLLGPLNRLLPRLVAASDKIGCPPVLAAALGNDAGIIGAANLYEAWGAREFSGF